MTTCTTVEQQLLTFAESCVTPGYEYFKAKFDDELAPVMSLF